MSPVELSGTMGSVSTSGISIVSPLRILSFQVSQDSGLGNDAFSAASASGLVGVKADRYNISPTMLNTLVEKPPTNRWPLAAIASNTGCTSDGELAITLRMSAVAVWRSSAARSRFFNLAVSDLGLSACRSPDFGLRDLGRADWTAVDGGLRVDLARLGAFARFAAFRARFAIAISHESLTNPGAVV